MIYFRYDRSHQLYRNILMTLYKYFKFNWCMILTKKNNGNKMFMPNNSDMTRTHNAGFTSPLFTYFTISRSIYRHTDTALGHTNYVYFSPPMMSTNIICIQVTNINNSYTTHYLYLSPSIMSTNCIYIN